ncbi:MAG: GxxExxY protein [Verrucomicrobiota bacterium]|nr:GxxExxY protein [Verrucomicrobiota bacterium]
MRVHAALGHGFLESVYCNALAIELRRAEFSVAMEKPISVSYGGEIVGSFVADLLVNGALIVELKAVQALSKVHEIQLVNYLTATGINDGLVLNFGCESLQFKRKYRLGRSEEASF